MMSLSLQQGRVSLGRGLARASRVQPAPLQLTPLQRHTAVCNMHASHMRRTGSPNCAFKYEGPSLSPKVEDTLAEVSNTISRWTNNLQNKWAETPSSDRPAAVAIIVGSVVAQIAIGATVDSIDKIPLFKQFFEAVGLSVALYTGYKYAFEPTHRDNLKKSISQFVAAVTGK